MLLVGVIFNLNKIDSHAIIYVVYTPIKIMTQPEDTIDTTQNGSFYDFYNRGFSGYSAFYLKNTLLIAISKIEKNSFKIHF